MQGLTHHLKPLASGMVTVHAAAGSVLASSGSFFYLACFSLRQCLQLSIQGPSERVAAEISFARPRSDQLSCSLCAWHCSAPFTGVPRCQNSEAVKKETQRSVKVSWPQPLPLSSSCFKVLQLGVAIRFWYNPFSFRRCFVTGTAPKSYWSHSSDANSRHYNRSASAHLVAAGRSTAANVCVL